MATDNNTQQAEITIPVNGSVSFPSLNHPTPKWAVYSVRALLWLTGAWVAMGLAGVLTSLGVPETMIHRVDAIMPVLTAIASMVARFIGIKPSSASSLLDAPVQQALYPNSLDDKIIAINGTPQGQDVFVHELADVSTSYYLDSTFGDDAQVLCTSSASEPITFLLEDGDRLRYVRQTESFTAGHPPHPPVKK